MPKPFDMGELVARIRAMLAKFEENGVIQLTASEGRRKSYIITDTGREMLRQEYGRLLVMVRDGSRFGER